MHLKTLLAACAAASVFALTTAHATEALEKFMKDYHKAPKGTDPICKKAGNGAATEDELAGLLEGYEDMAATKPPQGDLDLWKTKCDELIAAVKGLQAKDESAPEAYKKAVNCKACHSEFKPD